MMLSNPTRQPLFKALVEDGVPEEVALRAALLANHPDPRFVDYKRSEASAQEQEKGILQYMRVHRVAIITDHVVVSVAAGEPSGQGRADAGNQEEFDFFQQQTYSLDRLRVLGLGGPLEAWNAYMEQRSNKTTEPRTYVLEFGDDLPSVTIPLTVARQAQADETADCLLHKIAAYRMNGA
jgi:hypothetical protein